MTFTHTSDLPSHSRLVHISFIGQNSKRQKRIMAPALLRSFLSRALAARDAGDDIFAHLGPLAARAVLTARDDTATSDDQSNYKPGQGSIDPGSINQTGVFVLFGLISAAFVVAGIWFCFWAKNGGFHFKKDDWDDYKSTVLRRKGPNGTILSGATPSTQLGGGSVYKDVDDGETEEYSTVVSGATGLSGVTGGVSDFAGREKRRRSREKKEREREYCRKEKEKSKKKARRDKSNARRVDIDGVLVDEEAEAEAKAHLRSYRHERPARVGGINKESEGSAWDGSTNPSHSTMSGSQTVSQSGAGSTVPSELASCRQQQTTPAKTPKKKDGKGGIRKVYSVADNTADRGHERIRAEARKLQEKGRAARRDFSYQRGGADEASVSVVTPLRTGANASIWTKSDTTSRDGSELGTKVYYHPVHVPGTSSTDFAYAEEKRKKRAGTGHRREKD